jgi:FdhD protein
VSNVQMSAIEGGRSIQRPDRLVTEEPMEIRIEGPGAAAEALAVTMRTPGHDFELAAGFCRTEGIIAGPDDLTGVRYCLDAGDEQEYNVVTVATRANVDLEPHRRAFAANASCGLCGKATLDQVAQTCPTVTATTTIRWDCLQQLPDALRAAQAVFETTGGLHAAGVFAPDGQAMIVREDIGRHNAVDKVIGRALLDGMLPLSEYVMVVSGRVSFEIVQKAAVAGIPILAAVSAPSSLAVRAADTLGQTVVGFLRGDRANLYTHAERVVVAT